MRWSPLPEDCYKANFGVAFFEGLGSARVGIVYCDHTGQVIAALRQNIGSIQPVEMAEALAARSAVIFARELSLFRVIIEGDCLRVIQVLNCTGRCHTLFGHITNETKRLGGTLRNCSSMFDEKGIG